MNSDLLGSPELINESPYENGSLFELRPDQIGDIEDLMTADEYEGSLPALPNDD